MFFRQLIRFPLCQALLLLVAAGLCAEGMAALHPSHKAVAKLASIPTWRSKDLALRPMHTIRIAPLSIPEGATEIVLDSENFDTQVEQVAAQFHGTEWIVVSCQTPGCEEAWALAKRLRHFGFPQVALLRAEDTR